MQSALKELEGVRSVDTNPENGEVTVRYDADKVQPEQLAQAVTDSGFTATVKEPNAPAE